MVNPHWDEKINEDITITDLPPWSPQQEWGDVGGGGEFSGSRREEVLPSPNMPGSWRGGDEGWGNYPAGEFTGIETISPNISVGFGAPRRRGALRGIPSSAISGNRRGPGPWNDFSVGYDRDYTGPWIDNSYGMMDDDMINEIMMAELSGQQGDWMEGDYGSPDFYSNFGDYFDAVTTQEDKGPWWQFGGGAQEPATEQEVIDKLNQMMQEKNQRLPWPVV